MDFTPSTKTHPLEHAIPPPILVLVIALGMWWVSAVAGPALGSGTWRIVIAAPFLLAAFGFGAGGIAAFARAKTTVNPMTLDQASSLVTDGPFRLTRNPMYVGLAGLLFGWALILGVGWTLIGPLLIVMYINRFQIMPEERAMLATFGARYAQYQSRVRRWL